MISVYKYDPRAKVPTRNIATDAGADLYALDDVFIPLGSTVAIPTGLAINVPSGFVGKIEDRSSMAANGLKVAGGVIDAGYSGQISVILNNLTFDKHRDPNTPEGFFTNGYTGYQIKAGDRIAQILLYQVNLTGFMNTSILWNSERGKRGLGSSGK